MSIVLIRGTSGSGKTYIAESVIAALGGVESALTITLPDPKTGRHKIAAYVWSGDRVCVLGRYEAACGGCDAISWKGAADDLERIAVSQVREGRRVLLEGLMVATWGQERLLRLAQYGLEVVHLTTPLEACLAAVNDRRRARAEAAGREYTPVDPANTTAKHRTLETTSRNNVAAGIVVTRADRRVALARVRELVLGEERA